MKSIPIHRKLANNCCPEEVSDKSDECKEVSDKSKEVSH
jgi:hypothetical protein